MAKKRNRSLAGTNLYQNKDGIYCWRKVNEMTGKRIHRSTRTNKLQIALRIAIQFEDEYLEERAGLKKFTSLRTPIDEYLAEFIESQRDCSEKHLKLIKSSLIRATNLLKISTLADFDDFVLIEKKLLALEDKFNRKTLRRQFQDRLKQFTRFLTSRKVLKFDPLSNWEGISPGESETSRRAISPEEMARALIASKWLDVVCGRKYPTPPIWEILLITAPRITALSGLNINSFDPKNQRLLFGKGSGNKKRGAGALDDDSVGLLKEYIGKRSVGPLFLSPMGYRLDKKHTLEDWRSAFSLGVLDLEWPKEEETNFKLLYLTHLSLKNQKTSSSLGGPNSGKYKPGKSKRNSQQEMYKKIEKLAQKLEVNWKKRMNGVDLHCFRKTHRTWSVASGIPEIFADRQLGHSSGTSEKSLRTALSAIGRKHYTDIEMLNDTAHRSAQAVRKILNEAKIDFENYKLENPTAFSEANWQKFKIKTA